MRTFGKYRLLELLASGGMAEVWRAEVGGPGGFAKEVALKLVRADLAAEPELARLFLREARLASRLGHANVVQVFEFDAVEGRHYLAMELVRGRSLRQVVERCRETGLRLPLPGGVHVAAGVARALSYAHRLADRGVPLGIVHRDVSPHNVLLSFEGEVKLADFGIARALGAAEQTAPGTVKGKLAYMAPEQARGEAVDGRADVFALGVVLWELLAGRRLFARESDAATLAALLAPEPVSPPSAWNEEVPLELDAAVLGALERDPARRTPGADELLAALSALRLEPAFGDADLRRLMERLWPEGVRVGRDAEPTRVRPPPDEGEAPTRTLSRPGRLRGLAAGVALLALAAAGAALLAGGRGGEGSTAASAPAAPPTLTPTSTPAAAEPPGQGPTPPSTSSPPPTAAEPSTPPPTPVAPHHPSGPIGSLALPGRRGGEGILAVNASPWATVFIDGVRAGDTPREWRLPSGHHRLRASHPARGSAEAELEVRAGERRTWQPKLVP